MLDEPLDVFALLDELQTIARNGLHYTSSPYDRERYERLLALAARAYSQALDLPQADIREIFRSEMGQITPKIGADAAIFNLHGEILLMERADGSGWCLPCGWVEPNEKPIETVVREVREETGLEVVVTRLVGLFTRKPSAGFGPHTAVAVVHLCEVIGGTLRLSHEGLALKYWPIEQVPAWHANHKRLALAARAVWGSESMPARSD